MQTVTTVGLDIAKSVFQVHERVECPAERAECSPEQDEPAAGLIRTS